MNPWFWSFAFLALLGAALVWGLLGRAVPAADRDWTPEHAIAPTFQVAGDPILIDGIRNFRWHHGGSVEPAWTSTTLHLSEVARVWFGVSVFDQRWRGPAHTFLSFEFSDGRFLAVSVEARREAGERYSFIRGMLRRFEVLYVVADERDLLVQRAIHRPDQVYLYPLTLSPEQAQALFREMAAGAEAVRAQPIFYHTLRENCSTRIIDHLSAVLDAPLPRSCQILLPGYSDALLHDRGLIDTPLPLAQAREAAWINDRARRWQDAPDFSQRIRSHP
jgi:hypothetical protein